MANVQITHDNGRVTSFEMGERDSYALLFFLEDSVNGHPATITNGK